MGSLFKDSRTGQADPASARSKVHKSSGVAKSRLSRARPLIGCALPMKLKRSIYSNRTFKYSIIAINQLFRNVNVEIEKSYQLTYNVNMEMLNSVPYNSLLSYSVCI